MNIVNLDPYSQNWTKIRGTIQAYDWLESIHTQNRKVFSFVLQTKT